MGRIDPNLRAVLDSLSLEKGVRHPTADLEYLRTLVHRLGPADHREPEASSRTREGGDATDLPETPSGEGAPALEAELIATQEERDELARRYAELEARIARLEGGPGHSGGLSFDDPSTHGDATDLPEPEAEVRFQRIDAPPPRRAATTGYDDEDAYDEIHGEADPFAPHLDDDEDIMEFEGIAAPAGDWIEAPADDDEGWQVGQIPAGQADDSWADPAPPYDATADVDDDLSPTPDADAEYERLMKELADLEADLDAIGAEPETARTAADDEDGDEDQEATA